MTIDPNSINKKDVRELIIEGLKIGNFQADRVQTSDDPAIAEKEMKQLHELAKFANQRDWSPERDARLEAEAKQLKSELSAMLAPVPPSPQSLRDARDTYFSSKKGIATTTKKSYAESMDLFIAMVGGQERMVHQITRLECTQFNEALAHIPLHANKRGIKITLASEMLVNPPAVIGPDGQPLNLETIAARTANDHITNIKGFFQWAIKAGRYLSENPMHGQAPHSDGDNDGGAEAFTEDELKKIFAAETYMQAKRPHEYWGPLFALFTGARANEIACLDINDFIIESEVRCISINHRPRKKPDSIAHGKSQKRTKNKNSRRTVPLHPRLWELGLDEYLKDLAAIGATRFLPHLPMDSREKRERYLSRDVNNYLMKVGVHEPRTKVLHSFRDTVSNALPAANR